MQAHVLYRQLNVRLAEAPSFEQPITSYAPDSTGAADYRAIAVEWLERE